MVYPVHISDERFKHCMNLLLITDGNKSRYSISKTLILFRMGLFGVAHEWGGGAASICHTYYTMTKLGAVIPYLRKTQKIYETRDITLE